MSFVPSTLPHSCRALIMSLVTLVAEMTDYNDKKGEGIAQDTTSSISQ